MNHKAGKTKLTPHQRIVQACIKGKGVRLTKDEVFQLAYDNAIQFAASNDSYEHHNTTDWFLSDAGYTQEEVEVLPDPKN